MTPIIGVIASSKLKSVGGFIASYRNSNAGSNLTANGGFISTSDVFMEGETRGTLTSNTRALSIVVPMSSGTPVLYPGLQNINNTNCTWTSSGAWDTSANWFVSGHFDDTFYNYAMMAKYDLSTGTTQWVRQVGSSGNDTFFNGGNSWDEYNGWYRAAGQSYSPSGQILQAFSAAGGSMYQRLASCNTSGQGAMFGNRSGDGDFIWAFTSQKSSNTGTYYGQLFRVTRSPSVTWTRDFGSASKNMGFNDVFWSGDSSYISLAGQNWSDNTGIVVSYSGSGSLNWQREVTALSGGISGTRPRICMDEASNEVYALFTNNSSPQKAIILKFGGSGSLIWQRSLRLTSGGDVFTNFIRHKDGYLYVGLQADYGVSRQVLLKVPDAGTGTGSYSVDGWTYEYSSTAAVTVSTSSYSSGTGTLSIATSTKSVSTPSLSSVPFNPTTVVTNI